jgi:DNA-binding MurR/RpiR family transcriptional regulator
MPNLEERLNKQGRDLSPAERLASQELLDNYEDLPFLTADTIARQANVSASTVVRLVSKLEYKSYMDLQSEAQQRLKDRLSSIDRLRRVGHGDSHDDHGGSRFVSPSLEQDVRLILQFAENISIEDIRGVASLIIKAKKVLILGFRASAPPAYYLYLGLTQLLGSKIGLAEDSMLLPEYVTSLTKDDLLITFSFPRYSSLSVRAAESARNRQEAIVVAITNSILSPIANHADIVLTCPVASRAFQNSPIACYALVHVLIEQVIASVDDDTKRDLEQRLSGTEDLFRSWRWLINDNR